MKKSSGWYRFCKKISFFLFLVIILMAANTVQGQKLLVRTVREIPFSGAKDRPFFFKPFELLLSPAGIIVSETGDNCLKLIGPNGQLKMTIGKLGQAPGEFDTPLGLDLHDNKIYVADSFNHQVKVFSLEGKLLGGFRVDIYPVQLAVLSPDRIVVSSRPDPSGRTNSLLYCYDSKGKLNWEYLNPVPSSDKVYLTVVNEILLKKDATGNLFVFHKYDDLDILKLNSEGKIIEKIKLDPAYPLRKVELPLKSGKKSIVSVCWNVAAQGDKFYFLVPDSDGRGDLAPGKKVLVIDKNGKIVEEIRFPQAIRLLSTDGSTFYVLNTEDELFAYGVNQP